VLPHARREVLEVAQGHFPPEFLNRLDAQVVFNKLSHEVLAEVVSLRLRDVQKRLDVRGIVLDADHEVTQWLVDEGYSELYGARAVARTVREHVTNPLAQKLLAGTVRDRDTVRITVAADGTGLFIADNHQPDQQASGSASSIMPDEDEHH
jgi:ATP-dependent Clp protease ATP-binding subunit ClpB